MSDPVAALPLGSRVVVRARLDPRRNADLGGPSMTDAVGTLVSVDGSTVVVQTRRGRVSIERERVVAAKVVPPRPVRRGPPHRALAIDDLQRLMVDGWPPVEREPLGDWLLRAGSGFTRRANSVLVVGSPGMPVAAALDRAEGWYAARGLPAVASLAGAEGFLLGEDPVGAELLVRGYRPTGGVLVMTAAVAALTEHGTAEAAVELTDSLDASWLDAYRRQRAVVPGATEAVLAGSPEQLFASVSRGGRVVAVARLSVAHGWAGLSCTWVDPDERGRGLARAMAAQLARAAQARGIRPVWVQVERANAPALALYRSYGFRVHHASEYLLQPGSPQPAASGLVQRTSSSGM